MAKNAKKTGAAAAAAPVLGAVTFGLDTNTGQPCFLVLEVTGPSLAAGDKVKIVNTAASRQWKGTLIKQISTRFWLARVKFDLSGAPRIRTLDVDTLSVTVTSGGTDSNPAGVITNVYTSP